jgi:hypothetical protein
LAAIKNVEKQYCARKSGRGQPHSKTLPRLIEHIAIPQGFGVRLSSAAFSHARPGNRQFQSHPAHFHDLTTPHQRPYFPHNGQWRESISKLNMKGLTNFRRMSVPLGILAGMALAPCLRADEVPGVAKFRKEVRPILEEFCFDCHADGANKGGVAFDGFKSDEAIVTNRDLWSKALKNLRAGIMPPAKKPRPNDDQKELIARWIKYQVFAIDPHNPDPGRVTVRRLNRVEYRNTIHDLTGVDFDALAEFPPDDTGYGFDNISDVLTLPPMLLEKYVGAAKRIIEEAVPARAKFPNERFFPKAIPADDRSRRVYAREVLGKFARNAFRRPVDDKTVERLVELADGFYTQPGKTFEEGVGQGMVAVLVSPRFLFREEAIEPGNRQDSYPLVDEYSLASRLAYFLWSSMPDDQLMRLAAEGTLRKNLSEQVRRMMADHRFGSFIRDFTGQWLRARDIETVPIEARDILERENKIDPEVAVIRKRLHELRDKGIDNLNESEKEERTRLHRELAKTQERPPRGELNGKLRRAMRQETEKVFEYIVREDRSLLELIDSDYTFLNERLAEHYAITGVSGDEMQKVALPPDSPRGGILTQGTILATTSNPTRTSPVKRGLFILDSILGTPPPPPPPNIPPLEDAAKNMGNRKPSLRETLAAHRADALCSSCHNRMDPLGLALENFNALGMWRDKEYEQPIDSTGKLVTGETFDSVKELKQILVKNHYKDFYRTLTEKLLIYALGRGLDYSDAETVDQIVARIEKSNGKPSALLAGIIESAPFQKCRRDTVRTAKAVQGESLARISGKQ